MVCRGITVPDHIKQLTGILVVLAGMVSFPLSGQAQSGMALDEMLEKLKPYFADELLADIQNVVPRSAFRVWGWDVGDFTGDGFNDLAFSIYRANTGKKECQVFLLGDIDGYLINVASYTVPFVRLPLEVGVVIKDTTCFIAQKRRDDDWSVNGYRFDLGNMILVDEFRSNAVLNYDHESYRNYLTLQTSELYSGRKGELLFSSDYLTIPCYERSRQMYGGITTQARVYSIDDVQSGTFWWQGASDASFVTRFVYDVGDLYLMVKVTDDSVVTGWCDTCVADEVEVWFDVTLPTKEQPDRTIKKLDKRRIEAREDADSALYGFRVRLGDFLEVPPTLTLKTTDALSDVQQDALESARATSAQQHDGYVVKMKIPFDLLGFGIPPSNPAETVEIGCTVIVKDADNDFRPDEVTILATSPIKPLNPSTYGALRFIGSNTAYGESQNFFREDVLENLRELGF